jgi:hypothetical protein
MAAAKPRDADLGAFSALVSVPRPVGAGALAMRTDRAPVLDMAKKKI